MKYKYNILTDGITQSQIMNYMKCRRYFYLSLIRGWTEEILNKSIVLGICFHRCLELWYANLDEAIDLDHMVDHVLEEYQAENEIDTWTLQQRQDFEEVAARLHPLFPAYVTYWQKEDAKFKWDSLEHVFKVLLPITLRNGEKVEIPITGMIDGLITEGPKKRRVMDHKTKGRVNMGGITNTLLFDFQMNMYLWAANREFTDGRQRYNGIIYNLIHTSGLKQTATGPQGLHDRIAEDVGKHPYKYFNRLEKTITKKQESEFQAKLVEIVTEIANFVLLKGGKEDNRFLGRCLTLYGQCELLGICYDGNSQGLKRREAPHPELVDGHA